MNLPFRGVGFGLTYGRPEPAIEAPGAPAIETATLTVNVDEWTATPLA